MANQAYQITAPAQITLNSLGPLPIPGPNQALVRLHAASLNYRDILVIAHSPNYPVTTAPSLTPCSDGAGVISTVGPGSRWSVGDRVIVHPNSWVEGTGHQGFEMASVLGGGFMDGTLRRWMVVGDEALVRAPRGLGLEEASTVFTAGVTAFRALFHGGVEVGPAVTVLTQGTGGVSCYAIMFAAAAGATVIATSSSDEKLEVARTLGATHLINYRMHPDWAEKVLEATGGKGVDLVADVVGAQSMEQTLKATAFGGVVVILGILGENPEQPVNVVPEILFGAKTMVGQIGAGSREVHEETTAFMEKHNLHPPVAQVFEFEEAKEALKALTTLTKPGKIVVRC